MTKKINIAVALILTCGFFTACVTEVARPKRSFAKSMSYEILPSDNLILGGRIPSDDEEIRKTRVDLLDVEQDSLCTGTIIGMRLILTAAHRWLCRRPGLLSKSARSRI